MLSFTSGSTFERHHGERRGDVLQSFTTRGNQGQVAAQHHTQAAAATLVAPGVAGRRGAGRRGEGKVGERAAAAAVKNKDTRQVAVRDRITRLLRDRDVLAATVKDSSTQLLL